MTNEQNISELVFAEVEGSYIAGLNMAEIEKIAKAIQPGVETTIVPTAEKDIPKEYELCLKRVKEFGDWHSDGTFFLIKNFETYWSCKDYFPDEYTGPEL